VKVSTIASLLVIPPRCNISKGEQKMAATGISENLGIAKEKIKVAQAISGVPDVKLIGITKTRTPSDVAKLIIAGCHEIGENRVQEWEEKFPQVINELKIQGFTGKFTSHLVGHLQSNKARRAILDFDMIQSLDSLELAERLGRVAEEENKTPYPCLIQVKLGEEKTKSGIAEGLLMQDFEQFINIKGIRIMGLMLIAPLWAVGEDSRPYFHEMRDIFEYLKIQKDDKFEMRYLSMGMSSDFDIAVEEGANMVRIGRALFDGFNSL